MNRCIITGNLTFNPELKKVQNDVSVCTFTVAVNRRRREGQPQEADFFRVTAWRQLADNCAKYLAKGKKVGVVGTISDRAYIGKDGQPHSQLELTADDVEFLSPRDEPAAPQAPNSGFVDVSGEEPLPF